MRLLFEGGFFLQQKQLCGYYSRAGTIQCAGTIRGNTVCTISEITSNSLLIIVSGVVVDHNCNRWKSFSYYRFEFSKKVPVQKGGDFLAEDI